MSLTVLLLMCSALCFLNAQQVSTPVTVKSSVGDTDVLAEYNGGKILRSDLNNKISKLPPQVQSKYKTVDGQMQVLDIMTTEEVFYRKALQLNIQSDPIVMDKNNNGRKQFYIQEYYKRNVTDPVIVTDTAKRDFYNQNIKSFYISPYISILYIQAQDEAMAQKAYRELVAGATWDSVSDKYNINTYAKGLKGKIKNIRLNGYIPGVGNDLEFDKLIDATTVDTLAIHGPVETSTGWHLFRTIERVEGRQRAYSEVESELEQKVRPALETANLNAMMTTLKAKYSVTVDSTTMALINLKDRSQNAAIEDIAVIKSPNTDINVTVKQLLANFDKMSPQEQVFFTKGDGAPQLANQELTKNIMFKDAVAQHYEDYFKDNADYQQMIRYNVLQEVYKRIVIDQINIDADQVREYYDGHLDAYTTPESRAIEILWFENEKAANKAWKRYVKAAKKGQTTELDKIVKDFSKYPERRMYDNQYNNGIVANIGQDADFSKRIWTLNIGDVSPVFTTVKGDIVFFRVLKENPKVVKSFTEMEPRIFGSLKKEQEKKQQEAVTEQLYVEFDMKKYPEKITLLLTAADLFDLADGAARQRKFKDAIVYYDQIINNYKNNVDDYKATFMKAFLVTEEMGDKTLGLDLFKGFLRKFPAGDLNESAKFMIDEMEGKTDAKFEDNLKDAE